MIHYTLLMCVVLFGILHTSVSILILIFLLILTDSTSLIHIAIIFEIVVAIAISTLVLYSLIHKQWYKPNETKHLRSENV